MNITQMTNKQLIKGTLIIILISFLGFISYKYSQFRTVKMEKLRVEQVREEEEREAEARQKAFDDKRYRCVDAHSEIDATKSVLDITYKNNLLSVNLDCVDAKYAIQEISKKISIKIIVPDGLGSIRIPIRFSKLSINEGLDTISKKITEDDYRTFKFRYRPDKNIWSFDEVLIEVKDPPENGVTHIVRGKDSYDFVRADGTNKRSYSTKNFGMRRSENNKFVKISESGKDFIILNNQGDIQWKIKTPKHLTNYQLSNNGQYLIADDEDPECSEQCPITSYIITKKEIKKITQVIGLKVFSQDGYFFIGNEYAGGVVDVFDNQGNQIHSKKTIEEVKKIVPGFDHVDPKILD